MLNFIKRLFCRHYQVIFVRNIYGDEIIAWGWKRSVWRCNKCHKLIPAEHLHHSEKEPTP